MDLTIANSESQLDVKLLDSKNLWNGSNKNEVASGTLRAWKFTFYKIKTVLAHIKYIKWWKKELIPQGNEGSLRHWMKERVICAIAGEWGATDWLPSPPYSLELVKEVETVVLKWVITETNVTKYSSLKMKALLYMSEYCDVFQSWYFMCSLSFWMHLVRTGSLKYVLFSLAVDRTLCDVCCSVCHEVIRTVWCHVLGSWMCGWYRYGMWQVSCCHTKQYSVGDLTVFLYGCNM